MLLVNKHCTFNLVWTPKMKKHLIKGKMILVLQVTGIAGMVVKMKWEQPFRVQM